MCHTRYTCVIWCLLLLWGVWEQTLALSDKRLCADPKCQDTISLASATINYNAADQGMISFRINSAIRVKSKSAGRDPSVWGIEVNGRRGYAPYQFLRENKVLVKKEKLIYEVDVEQPQKAVEAATTPKPLAASEVSETLETATPTLPAQSQQDGIVTSSTEQIQAEAAQPTPVQQLNVITVDGTALPAAVELPVAAAIAASASQPGVQAPTAVADGDAEQTAQTAQNVPKKDIVSLIDDEDYAEYDEEDEYDEEKEEAEELVPAANQAVKENQTNAQNSKDSAAAKETNEITSNGTADSSTIEKVEAVESPENLTGETAHHKQPEVAKIEETTNTRKQQPEQEQQGNQAENLIEDTAYQKQPEAQPKEENAKATTNTTAQLSEQDQPVNQLVTNTTAQQSEQVQQGNQAEKVANQKQPEVANAEATTNITVPEQEQQSNQVAKSKESLKEQQNEEEQLINAETAAVNNEQKTEIQQAQEKEQPKLPAAIPTTLSNEAQTISQELTNDGTVLTKETATNVLESNKITADNSEQLAAETKEQTTQQVNAETEASVSESTETIKQIPTTEAVHLEEKQVETAEVQQEKKNETTATATQASNEVTLDNEQLEKQQNSSATEIPAIADKAENKIETASNTLVATELNKEESSNQLHVETQQGKTETASSVLESNEIINESSKQQVPEAINKISMFGRSPLAQLAQHQHHHHKHEHEHQHDQHDEHDHSLHDTHHSNQPYLPAPNDNAMEQQQQQPLAPTATEAPLDYAAATSLPTPTPTSQTYESNLYAAETPYHEYTTATPIPTTANQANQQAHTNTVNQNQFAEPAASDSEVNTASAVPSTVEQPKKPPAEQSLFGTILDTVNSLLPSNKREAKSVDNDNELERILYPDRYKRHIQDESEQSIHAHTTAGLSEASCSIGNSAEFLDLFANKVLEEHDFVVFLLIAAGTTLFFAFGYYCFCNSSREGALLSKLNLLERSLLAVQKENAILKHDLLKTRKQLTSIEDNSFGSNDMVVSLRKELERELLAKEKLQEQVKNLEKELENAAEAGLELNKIVAELLSNQTGDESIISSVEDLQKQLNEQQNTILEINSNLAEKSRENSELQLMLAEQNARLGGEIASLQQDNDELESEKSNLQTRLEDIKNEYELEISKALEGKNFEIKRLQADIVELQSKLEQEHTKWQTGQAKIEALEECLKSVKKDPSVNIKEVINVANVRAELLDLQRQKTSIKERFDAEVDARLLLENQVKAFTAEIEKLKHDFNQSEKDKLEAQTRLEVLSNYFKEKETQLQRELSIKEAMWLKQQGETTSTVDRVTAMQEDIQSLKSQNDALRAEIEAQVAAHKAQIGTLENRAHETWLAARQTERRYEEARAEATALRRKLTALAGQNPNELARGTVDGQINDLNSAPSPINMDSPGSPLLGRMPPPPFLPPVPFMAPPPPFLAMPPPFIPPGELRPAPLGGRMISPPPPGAAHLRRHMHDYSYNSDHGDYDYYDDDDDDEDDDDEGRQHSSSRGRRRSWTRDYSPPRTYRSHSPTDSRYNYNAEHDLISTYDTETDLSPPPTPRDRHTKRGNGNYSAYSPQPMASSSLVDAKSKKSSKGLISSSSEKSSNSSRKINNGRSMV